MQNIVKTKLLHIYDGFAECSLAISANTEYSSHVVEEIRREIYRRCLRFCQHARPFDIDYARSY